MVQTLPGPTRTLWPKALPSDFLHTHRLPETRKGWSPENSGLGSLASSPMPRSPSSITMTTRG